ncbi:DUF4407 domain-containing protein [Micromonospora sp. LAH09]|uniref:DUF4407 domain-containing protein n=1 Tax=Micromonospora cabrerizensis TaxID=2911213 RepID=UPI001EE8471E|nr:DUF4407 domain-containing protein [Micromonospora cabrerizensis]MCG5469187.1 DUF4407 domain-containing protein [Micromonospora cabrerizensis]
MIADNRTGNTAGGSTAAPGNGDPDAAPPADRDGAPESDDAAALAAIAGRPAPAALPKWWNAGRFLRGFCGTDEALLAWVPQERARYTGMGGAVLFTALMAFGSMSVALVIAFPAVGPLAVLPAAGLWFLLILNFDRWLVTTPLSSSGIRRLGTVLIRLGMALIFGIVVAEPLVLVVFQSAVSEKVKELREDEVRKLRATWEGCNPLDSVTDVGAAGGTPVTTAPVDAAPQDPAPAAADDTCGKYVIPPPTAIRALQNEYASKQQQLVDLQKALTPLREHHDALVKKSQDECLGKPGIGQTGQYGDGPVCKRLTQDAAEYARLNRLDPLTSSAADLTGQLQNLTERIREESVISVAARQTYIDVQADARRAGFEEPGLLERIEALHRLAAEHAALALGIWAVRALFILVDLAPALVKFNSGPTTYDRLAQRSLNLGEMRYSALALEETARAHRWADDQKEDLDVERARSAAGRAAEYDTIVDELERHWARAASELPHPTGAIGPADRGFPMSESTYSYIAEEEIPQFDPPEPAEDEGSDASGGLTGNDQAVSGDGDRLRRAFRSVPRMNVVTLGGVGVGKTALMAVMFAELEDDEEWPGRGYRVICPDAEQRDTLSRHAHAVKAPGVEWPERTNTAAVQEYGFNCLVRVDHEEIPVLRLRYFDYAGELIERGAEVDRATRVELARRVESADAVLLMVDGVRLRECEGDARDRLDFGHLLNNCVRWIEGASGPVQVVVTKWDCLEGEPDSAGRPWTRERLVLALERYPAMRRLAARRPSLAGGGGGGPGLRVIPVSVVGAGAVQERRGPGYPLMEKVRPGTPINVDVPFAGLLPDRLLQVLDGMGHAALRSRIRTARRRRIRYRVTTLLTRTAGLLRGLTLQLNLGVGSVGWQHQAATDPNAGWVASGVLEERLVTLRRDIARDTELVGNAQELRRRADWSLRAKLRVLECFTRRLARFDREFPGRGLRNTTVGE